jgi:hypothetical protein
VKVAQAYSIDEIFEEVKDYDLVFTADAALKDALNRRLEEPLLGHFATTPMTYVFSKFQNDKLLQERDLFIEIVQNTDISWKQSSYLLENVIDCWKNEGDLDKILEYERFDKDSTREVIKIIEDTKNIFKEMDNVEIDEDTRVAVVNFHQLNEIDKQVLPEEFDCFNVFKDEETELPDFKVFNSTTEVINAVAENISKLDHQDVAVVSERGSTYSMLLKSELESRGTPVIRQEELKNKEDLRTLINLFRLSLNNERLQVRECRPVMTQLGFEVPIKLDNDNLADIQNESVEEFRDLLNEVKEASVDDTLGRIEGMIETDIRQDFEELGILNSEVSERMINKLEYYLDTYNVEKNSSGEGVLMANVGSATYIDKPVVFYLGMDSGWTPNIPNNPWTDKEDEDETRLKNFKALVQNGEQQHYIIQDKKMDEDVTPCLYFNEIADVEFESFRGLPYERYQSRCKPPREGFEKKDYNVEIEKVELFSQSSLNSFVKSPKEYLFDKVTDSPDKDYFRKGTLYHDFAEFYANHGIFVEDKGIDEFVQIMLEEMESIVDDLEIDLLETEFRIGLENIKEFVDNRVEKHAELKDYTQQETQSNLFAERFDKDIEGRFTEAWFENKELGVKGLTDLIINKNHLTDYKSSKNTKSAEKIVSSSNLELLEDDPNFQAMLYLTELRNIRPDQKLEFTFFYFLDNIEDEITGDAALEDKIVTITYYPTEFDDFVQSKEMYNFILQSSRGGGKVRKTSDRRNTLEVKSSYEAYREFFENHEITHQFDEEKIQESDLADKMTKFFEEDIGKTSGYIRDGCEDALRRIAKYRKRNYFRNDIDRFEVFVQKQLGLLNEYREEGFPVQNPEIDDVDIDQLDSRDMMPE